MEIEVENLLKEMKRSATLDYAGAVEIQTRLHNVYSKFTGFSKGLPWAYDSKSEVGNGSDRAEFKEGETTSHNHPDTMAETTTASFGMKQGGGQSIGDFTSGRKLTIGSGSFSSGLVQNQFKMMGGFNGRGLTEPLYGQNVLDWRCPDRTHNNLPPSTNVIVRYMKVEDVQQ